MRYVIHDTGDDSIVAHREDTYLDWLWAYGPFKAGDPVLFNSEKDAYEFVRDEIVDVDHRCKAISEDDWVVHQALLQL